jgi:hypothetical protein
MTGEDDYWDLIRVLNERLRNRKNYAAQDPLKDPYYKGLQKGALSEVEFLKALLGDLVEGDEQ